MSADSKQYLVSKIRPPRLPIGLNGRNVGRSVCPAIWKSTYGSSLAKHQKQFLIDQITMSPPGKMPGKEYGSLHGLCRPYQAADTVIREGLWKIMAKLSCPANFMAMARRFHNDGKFSVPFPVPSGVKQGCVPTSTLFSMMFSAMLINAFQVGDKGIPIRYRFDGKLLNLKKNKLNQFRQRC